MPPTPQDRSPGDDRLTSWATVPTERIEAISAAFDAGGMSAGLKARAARIFNRREPSVALVPRVDMRGVKCRVLRSAQRPRERRTVHGRRRRTTTSRDDGSPAGSSEPAPGRRTVYAFGLDAWRLA